ncbi:hypothetical protein DVH24_018306 [Malus domestica]|uniref:RNase H type-1 domain-containing protein n=1 Tax=Malus domestica TaxID=3750 RepID=A0A498KIM0_MALDO|nr:hypothetical protein DVH24_018306 [Malus domestica]
MIVVTLLSRGQGVLEKIRFMLLRQLALQMLPLMALNRGFQNICVENDSKLVIDAIWHSSKNQNNILDIISLTLSFLNISWKHSFRKFNFVADVISNVEFSSLSTLAWNQSILYTAIQALKFDQGATGYTRDFPLN